MRRGKDGKLITSEGLIVLAVVLFLLLALLVLALLSDIYFQVQIIKRITRDVLSGLPAE